MKSLKYIFVLIFLISCEGTGLSLKKDQDKKVNLDIKRPSWLVSEAPSELQDLFEDLRDNDVESLVDDEPGYDELSDWKSAISDSARNPANIVALFSGVDITNISSNNEKAAYLMYTGEIYEALGRQPSMQNSLLGYVPTFYDTNNRISSEVEQIGRFVSYGQLIGSCVRQPSICNDLVEIATDYSRAGEDFNFKSSSDVILSRAYVVGELLVGIARQPGQAADLLAKTKFLIGDGANESNEDAKAWERAYLFGVLINSVARQPVVKNTMVAAMQAFIGNSKATIKNNALELRIETYVNDAIDNGLARQPAMGADFSALKAIFY